MRQLHPDGLQYYQIACDPATRPPASSWPRLSVSPDQGGDGLAAYRCLTRRLKYNIDMTADPSHGANNDLWLFLDGIGLKGLMLQFLISFNTPHGPWAEDTRCAQALTAFSQLLETSKPTDVPLFMECVSDMIEEKRDTEFIFGADPAQALLDDLRLNHPWKVKGSQCVRSRFLAFTREAKKELKQYSARQIDYQHLCLEMGWLGGTQAKLLKVGGGGVAGAGAHNHIVQAGDGGGEGAQVVLHQLRGVSLRDLLLSRERQPLEDYGRIVGAGRGVAFVPE